MDRLEFDMKLGGKLYIDGAIKFSWVCCSAGFQMTLESELYFIHRNVYSAALVIISGSYTQKSSGCLRFLHGLQIELGLVTDKDNFVPRTEKLSCLGNKIDIESKALIISKDKILEIYTECLKVRQLKTISRKSFQSVAGKLFHIYKCVKTSETFINRTFALL